MKYWVESGIKEYTNEYNTHSYNIYGAKKKTPEE